MTDTHGEKRTTGRTRSFLKGRIVYNHGAASVDCLVRNISPTGAKIELTASVTLPERFELHLPQKEETRPSRMRWRRQGEAGLTFLEALTPASATSSEKSAYSADQAVLVARIAELEIENARLRRLATDLEAARPSRSDEAPAT